MKRSSNFELLRILLMICVPVYHFVLYTGIIFGQPMANTNFGLMLCSGSAIVADYAFMAMSFYFLQQKGRVDQKKRICNFLIQVAICLAIKLITIFFTYGFKTENVLAQQFFFKGSWWFVYAYIVILIIYPYLNMLIEKLSIVWLSLIVILMFIYMLYIWAGSRINYVNDAIIFIGVYLFMGILKKQNYKRLIFIRNTKSSMFALYLIGAAFTYILCLYFRWIYTVPMGIESQQLLDKGDDFIRLFTGKYCPWQALMGIAVFLLFRGIEIKQSRAINYLAKSVIFVFLLHESVLCVLYYTGVMEPGTVGFDAMPVSGFCIYMAVYVLLCFAAGLLVRFCYGLVTKK